LSGHSKWSSIKHKKGAADAKRGKLFTKLARSMLSFGIEYDRALSTAFWSAALFAGSLPPSLAATMIERASFVKGAGEGADGAAYETVIYEGYGPEGVAVLVEALTDNRNRTAAEMRHAFTKFGGALGATGAVAWQFERRGVVVVAAAGVDEEELFMAAADAGAEDLEQDGEVFQVTSAPEHLTAVRDAIQAAGFAVESAELSMIPKTTVAVESESAAKTVMRLIEALEDDDDVQEVYANFDIPEQVLEAVAS
jgi:YebC/PmpR family DNA-binding regulatory protein